MATWTFADGTQVSSGGVVAGASHFAERLRADFEFSRSAFGPLFVGIVAPPGGDVRLDLGNDWLLDRYARNLAARQGLTLTSDYEARDEDMPEAARSLIESRASDDTEEEDELVVY